MWANYAFILSALVGILPGPSSPLGIDSQSDRHSRHSSNPTAQRGVLLRPSHAVRQSATPAGIPDATKSASTVLSVDGQRVPEQIPDHVAYRHFISVTAARSGASETELYIRNTVLARVGLSDADRSAYLAAISSVRDELQDVEQQIRAVHHDTAAVNALRLQRERILDNAVTHGLSAVSTEGASRMRAHVHGYVKSRIKIYTATK